MSKLITTEPIGLTCDLPPDKETDEDREIKWLGKNYQAIKRMKKIIKEQKKRIQDLEQELNDIEMQESLENE